VNLLNFNVNETVRKQLFGTFKLIAQMFPYRIPSKITKWGVADMVRANGRNWCIYRFMTAAALLMIVCFFTSGTTIAQAQSEEQNSESTETQWNQGITWEEPNFKHRGWQTDNPFHDGTGTNEGDSNNGNDGANYSQSDNTYYADAYGKEGEALKASLHEIIDDHNELSYSQVWDALKITDEDPANPSHVILLYSGESRPEDRNGGNVGEWNREHVWAKSHGDFGTSKGPGTDIHHLRPSDVQVNSSRGNLDFDNGGNANVKNCEECKRDENSFEPPDEAKGDVARMLFYMDVRYEGEESADLELNNQVGNGNRPYHGKASVLLEWHKQDPVSEWEEKRNDEIQAIQGNRNPFIDHPEFAEAILEA